MKPFLAIITGFLVSSGVFISGAALATYLIMAEPVREPDASQNVAELWSHEPRAANAATQDLQRIPASVEPDISEPEREVERETAETYMPTDPPEEGMEGDLPDEGVDMVSTGSIGMPDADSLEMPDASGLGMPDTEPREPSSSREALPRAHVEWCADKYRSYRAETNSYRPYSGGVEPCVSPYMNGVEPASDQPQYADGSFLSFEHVQDCLSRYRSYRPEDNTYQPYGGGPRRQCR